MKICLAQLNYRIGDFEQNTAKIAESIQEARLAKADLIIFSELAICGYPPEDLLDYKGFTEDCEYALEAIAQAASQISVLIGGITINKDKGRHLFNSAIFIENGKIQHRIHKTLLPTYDVFNELRYFEPGHYEQNGIIEIKGIKFGIAICEDLWDEFNDFSYHYSVVEKLVEQGAQIILHPSASPYSINKERLRNTVFSAHIIKYKIPIIYVNQVGAHAEIIFDGSSRVLNSEAQEILRLPSFKEKLGYITLDTFSLELKSAEDELIYEKKDALAMMHDALVFGIKEYFKKTGATKAIIGSSGGIDSAVVQALACKALGASNVFAVLLPSEYSSEGSVKDAEQLCTRLGNPYKQIPIHNTYSAFIDLLTPEFHNKPFDTTEENIQARIRGMILMALSNKHGYFLLNTSNKSEMAVGYSTLYGDLNGSLSVLGDVLKTKVYQLANYINTNEEIIPLNIIQKAPSAELRPGQKDSDSLPEYDILDEILFNYIERKLNSAEIIALGFEAATVKKVLTLVDRNEYKRFQAPPILRVTEKAFGKGRVMPLVARYDS